MANKKMMELNQLIGKVHSQLVGRVMYYTDAGMPLTAQIHQEMVDDLLRALTIVLEITQDVRVTLQGFGDEEITKS